MIRLQETGYTSNLALACSNLAFSLAIANLNLCRRDWRCWTNAAVLPPKKNRK
jgi:hypothetical protein